MLRTRRNVKHGSVFTLEFGYQWWVQDFPEGAPTQHGTNLLLPPATKFGQGYVFTHVCDSVHKGGVSQHALQVVSQNALQQVSKGGVVSQHALQPNPGGKLRGLARRVSRPTPKGEIEGSGLGGLQARIWGDL